MRQTKSIVLEGAEVLASTSTSGATSSPSGTESTPLLVGEPGGEPSIAAGVAVMLSPGLRGLVAWGLSQGVQLRGVVEVLAQLPSPPAKQELRGRMEGLGLVPGLLHSADFLQVHGPK